MLKAFVTIKGPGGEFVTTCEKFFHELKQFSSDSRNDYAEFWERDHDGHHSRLGVDLFLQNVKLQGEAVRKSRKRLKTSDGFG